MGLNLIMKRQVFAVIQNLAVEYEEEYGKRKGLTPLITNQLLAEALIARGKLPENFLKDEYGKENPLLEGFSYRGFRDEAAKKKRAKTRAQDKNLEGWPKRFSEIAKEWNKVNDKSKQWHVKKARELIDKVPEAKLILDLDEKDKKAE